MKKLLLLFLLMIFLFFTYGCAVNETTGVITVSNQTDLITSVVRLDSTVLANLFSGGKADYWFYHPMSGKITVPQADMVMSAVGYDHSSGIVQYEEKSSCEFRPNYRYEIRIIMITVQSGGMSDSLIVAYVEPGVQDGESIGTEDFYHYPGR